MNGVEILLLNRVLRVFDDWSRGAEARDALDQPIHLDDPCVRAFSLDGALFRVLGPVKAMEEIIPFLHHMTAHRIGIPISTDPYGMALRLLVDFNDQAADWDNLKRRLLTIKPNWGQKPVKRPWNRHKSTKQINPYSVPPAERNWRTWKTGGILHFEPTAANARKF